MANGSDTTKEDDSESSEKKMKDIANTKKLKNKC